MLSTQYRLRLEAICKDIASKTGIVPIDDKTIYKAIVDLDLPKERWEFIKSKLEPHKNDSETVTLFCLAIESLDFEVSIEQRIFQVLSGSSKNHLKFPTARTLQDCSGGAGLVTEINRAGLSLPKLEYFTYFSGSLNGISSWSKEFPNLIQIISGLDLAFRTASDFLTISNQIPLDLSHF